MKQLGVVLMAWLLGEVVVVLEVEVVLENSLLDSAVVDDNLPC